MMLFLIGYYTLNAQYMGQDGGGRRQFDTALRSNFCHFSKKEKKR